MAEVPNLNFRWQRPDGIEWEDDERIERFRARLNAQVAEDHARAEERNRQARRIRAASPAMAIAGLAPHMPESELEWAVMNNRLLKEIAEEPIVARYANHLDHGMRPHANTEWWHAFGHQRIAAMTVLSAMRRPEVPTEADMELSMPCYWDGRMFHSDDQNWADFGPAEASFEWAGRVGAAQTYLWTQECLEAAVAAPLVPHIVQPNALPYESLFFSFEMAAWLEFSDLMLDKDRGTEVRARSETWWVLVSQIGDAGIMLTFSLQLWPDGPYQPQEHIVMEPIEWGSKWPEDFQDRRFVAQIGATLRMLSFMQAPFVDAQPSRRRLDRPARREYDRKGSPAPEPAVSIVTLRRPLHEPLFTPPQEGEDGPGRDYKHSWWVGGHYRWQYYPSTNDHKLIPIAPYMKQIGKPLLPRLHIVKD